MTSQIDQNALYPIREVSRITGIKTITLRAWERRYDLITPVRTESGHRLYTQEHIDYLNEALRLMDEGVPISRVKVVLSELPTPSNQSTQSLSTPEQLSILIKAISQSVSQFKIQELEQHLDRLFADHSTQTLLNPLAEIEQHIKQLSENHLTMLNFWRSSLIRRLDVRLHNLQSLPILPTRRIFIQKAAQTPSWMARVVALFCFEQGHQPILLDEPVALEGLIDVTEQLNFKAMIFLDFDDSAQLEWKLWFQHYASLRTWVFGNHSIEEKKAPSMNCELRAWPNWFRHLQF